MKSHERDLLLLAEELVRYGRKQGAEEVEVRAGEGVEFSVDVRNGEIEKLVEAGSRGISIKVIVEQRVATASSSDLSAETLHDLIEGAVERARLSSLDPAAGLPDLEPGAAEVEDLNIFDPSVLDLSAEEKIKTAVRTEAICLADERIKNSHGAGYGTTHTRTCLANSRGFSGAYEATACSCGVYLQAGQGDNLLEDGWYDASRNLSGLMSAEAIAEKALHRVTRLIGAKKVKTQNVPVVFEAPMTGSLLGFLYSCIDGHGVYLKQSFLADMLGESIAHENVTIMDDGRIPGAPASRPFDGEGVPTRRTPVVQKGVLKNFLMDTYAARKLGMRSTGNASGPNNFHLKAGPHTPEEIIRSVGRGLLLTGTIGQGLNPVTGDISRGAFGMWIENGEIAHPVAEITISGNLGRMLKNIEMIGSDLEFKSSVAGPTIKIGEMTVGGM